MSDQQTLRMALEYSLRRSLPPTAGVPKPSPKPKKT